MASVQHHHRSTTKTFNKPFKTRHSTKSAIKNQQKGKVEVLERGTRKTPHQQVMSKLDRRNQAKQRRVNHQIERDEKTSVFAGKSAASRIVAIVPLCDDIAPQNILRALNESVDAATDGNALRPIEIPRFKQRIQYLTPVRELLPCLDACRVADYVVFALSAQQEVDQFGEQLLRCVESQGVSTALTGVYNLDQVEPAKKRPDVIKSLKSFITHFFASQEKVHDFGNRQECSNVMRSLCTTMPKGIKWRESRSWMYVEDLNWSGIEAVVTGVVRGCGLTADRLVHAGDWGDLQIDKITAAPFATAHKRVKSDSMAIDDAVAEEILEIPSEEQDDLHELAPEDVTMGDFAATSIAPSERKGVLLDDHHYFEDDDEDAAELPKRLPRGTSKYQAAWYLNDFSDSGSDLEDVDDEMTEFGEADATSAGPADGHFDDAMPEPTEGAPSEYPQSEAFFDPAPEEEKEQLEAYRKQRRKEVEEDLEFPDEIELHPGVSARERLAKYRGLKDFRYSRWETDEDRLYEPNDWNRLLEVADYKSARNRVLKDSLTANIRPGTRVNIHLRIPAEQRDALQALQQPTALYSLLKHEHKQTAANVSITLSADHPHPVKSKDPIIMQCGPRRLLLQPLYSQAGNTPNNVHKFDRYLHPGRSAVASYIGPIVWGSVPCLFFQQPSQPAAADAVEDLAQSLATSTTSSLSLIATGTTMPPSSSRVIAKRVILTGHPYKIHKRLVTVRYMFFSQEDVQYFKALQLWTRRGRSGYIKETLGTHGYFKATFDNKINPLDAVAVSLYKRVWPRSAVPWHAGMLRSADDQEEGKVPQLMEVE